MPNLKVTDGRVTASKFNALVEYANSLKLNSGVGYTVARYRGGTVIKTKPGGGGDGNDCPFSVTISESSETELTVIVSPGTVNFLLPDNIFDEFTVSKSAITKVKARATSDGQTITGVTLIVDDDDPEIQAATPYGLPTSVDIVIAVICEEVVYRTVACGSITLSGAEQFKTDRSPPAEPGELPYVPYYIWK